MTTNAGISANPQIDEGTRNQTPTEMMEKISDWISEMELRAQNLQPVLEPIAQEIKQMALEASQNHRTPGGIQHPPLSPTTTQIYSEGSNNGYRGSTGRLANSFQTTIQNNAINIFSDLPYANAQMFGNPNNRIFGGSVITPTPARPYFDIVNGALSFPEDNIRAWEQNIMTYICGEEAKV